MDESTQWWLMAGVLVVAELATGTIYLLMIALGAVAGALAAHAGFSTETQLVTAALVAVLTVVGWYWRKKRQQRNSNGPLGTQIAPDLALDLGQVIQVNQWSADGTAQVMYRGAHWQARLAASEAATAPQAGSYRICAMQGNTLLLEKV